MTREETLRALADGKQVEHYIPLKHGGEWVDLDVDGYRALHPSSFVHSFWRIKPTPTMIPLGPEDVPPGSVVRMSEWRGFNEWRPVVPRQSCVIINGISDISLTYHDLQRVGWEISRDFGKTWQRCEKEA